MLTGKTVVLGVTGGIAAYKAADLASRLIKLGAQVYAVMTRNACAFLAPLTLETLTNHPVAVDLFARPATWEVEHIALAKRADLFVVAPATANLLGKLACGIADDMLTTTLLATRAPVLVAPAMNTGMWQNEAVWQNVRTLQARGVGIVPPESGRLACGDEGEGRLAAVETIVRRVCDTLSAWQDLAGRRVLVTAGPTREPLDPVRCLTNRSSGKMGYALAQAAAARGAQVLLLSGPVALPPPPGIETLGFETTGQLFDLMLTHAPRHDLVLQAAAPADFQAEQVEPQKIKKQGGEGLTLRLSQTPDIAAAVGQTKRPGQILVAFAAETGDVEAHAREKLVRKNADLIVANDVTQPGAGFDADTNIATLITRNKAVPLPQMTKRELADKILDAALGLL
ncbi:MAG: bifunctional phosphopantothenoylcysteine decarboxylase/phosphopantothenate--cysteine ligase CoaBC [Oscillospiraceae bacterium]|jgi:phosphopantothenoylcysteine decarboxylase/phosphopantothenate--cysteine ligase|nr:bifunctional phosphopantothenoylcysteine decarboxylase/phosphopantothenate--cysteine ligase CoaBC [Oscillospiraceae bacterium]